MRRKNKIESTNWLTRGVPKKQLEQEKQEAIMAEDLRECFAELSFDFDGIAEKMTTKGYRKQDDVLLEFVYLLEMKIEALIPGGIPFLKAKWCDSIDLGREQALLDVLKELEEVRIMLIDKQHRRR